jgi:hypothetical protein
MGGNKKDRSAEKETNLNRGTAYLIISAMHRGLLGFSNRHDQSLQAGSQLEIQVFRWK